MNTAPERRQAAIFYVELRNFTRLSEMLQPDKVLALANEFFSLCAMGITARSGKVLSVHNDVLIAAFAGPNPKAFASHGLDAAQDVQREFGAVAAKWKNDYGLPAAVASALHIGEAVFGMAGPIGHQQFVAFGDCVSVTERLVHRARSGEVIFSADYLNALGVRPEGLGAQKLPPLEIPKREPIAIHSLVVEDRLDFT
jgi:adenylate cyclase